MEDMRDNQAVWNRDGALHRLMDNETLLNRILEIFFDQGENRMTQIRDDIQQGRLDEARATTHGLKGSAGEVGAERLHSSLNELEKALMSHSTQAAEMYQIVVMDYQQFSQQAR